MDRLSDIAAKAKREGACTENWTTVRNRYLGDELQSLSGTNDMRKIEGWAESQGLLMKFDYELEGFTSIIRTVTFTPKPVGRDQNQNPLVRFPAFCGGLA